MKQFTAIILCLLLCLSPLFHACGEESGSLSLLAINVRKADALLLRSGKSVYLIDTGRASQTVDIASPGRYCLRFYSRMRIHGSFPNEPYRYGKNTLHVYLAKDGVTNSLAKILCDTTNFVGQCIRFDVPAAASDWSLGFEGMNVPTASYRDKCIFVDGVSLKRCTDEPSSAMPIPKTLTVSELSMKRVPLQWQSMLLSCRLRVAWGLSEMKKELRS